MAFKRPPIDSFSKNLNNITPSVTENLSPSIKRNQITNTIKNVKGAVCDKIDGAIDIITGITTGSIDKFKLPGFDKDSIGSFFTGPLDNLTGKLKNVFDSFSNIQGEFTLQDQILELELEDELKNIEKESIQRFESAKINKDSFKSPMQNIGNLSNKQIKDISLDPIKKASLSSGFCSDSENNLINNALTEKSIANISKDQELNLSKINDSFLKFRKNNLNLTDEEKEMYSLT